MPWNPTQCDNSSYQHIEALPTDAPNVGLKAISGSRMPMAMRVVKKSPALGAWTSVEGAS